VLYTKLEIYPVLNQQLASNTIDAAPNTKSHLNFYLPPTNQKGTNPLNSLFPAIKKNSNNLKQTQSHLLPDGFYLTFFHFLRIQKLVSPSSKRNYHLFANYLQRKIRPLREP
jgi:hypothetical protein